ncbi:unnamed protein product [Aphanomyces euteiches]|uniref:Uncharacterized protein n=1 Tax=Aphanomyces euteiches TaxID=100861 RepID=A0A6G0XXL1_9STRA|nr:hypothetical protein Ae201684_000317 [Aphanomyces euteiches]KAH9091966.1 hypothetical protein Ae201684P_011507 [Aphanomyces euteiches]KAH9139991.1 hypothetical protein AeRB84_015766 [Aphanomyces euteiches]
MTTPIRFVAISAGVGSAGVALAGVGAGALVPTAMSYFGAVVPGVGTLHAAGGVAATLQWTAATLGSASTVAWGGAIGGAVGSVVGAFWK